TVIDATIDGRIAQAAGVKMDRTLEGINVCRRFISVDRPEYLPTGKRIVPSHLGISGDTIMVYDDYIEFAINVEIGQNIGKDISDIQGKTLEISFLLREHLHQEGIDFEQKFIPAPETWFDKIPIAMDSKKGSNYGTADLQNIHEDALVSQE